MTEETQNPQDAAILDAASFMQVVDTGTRLDEKLIERENTLRAKELLEEAKAMIEMFVPVKITQQMRDLGIADQVAQMAQASELRFRQTLFAQAGDFHAGATLAERTAAARSKLLKERLEAAPSEDVFFG